MLRPETYEKYKTIQDSFQKLYQVERLRYDDCIERLAKKFFLTKRTVERILTKKLN
jgi:hypothetical protein